ncbi:MAG: hypothetical protein GY874_17205 [Desulfobacteraceae bacterium]|nr:hypothetical protein [Desulfobacteraceae bacterium]
MNSAQNINMLADFPIAMIPYANMAPFHYAGPPSGCRFVPYAPRDSIHALRAKQVWAAAAPVGGLAKLTDIVTFSGDFGIAARGPVMSVLLFSDRPFSQFQRPATLRLTSESASSVRLLYLLLGYAHGFENLPFRCSGAGPANGELKIGDTALIWAKRLKQHGRVQTYQYVTDLCSLWYNRHRLPFVFARWVVRRDAPGQLKENLLQWLEDVRVREKSLIDLCAPVVARNLNFEIGETKNYLSLIRRCLGQEDLAGQDLFLSELKRYLKNPLFEQAA